jgi:hypothetical protein
MTLDFGVGLDEELADNSGSGSNRRSGWTRDVLAEVLCLVPPGTRQRARKPAVTDQNPVELPSLSARQTRVDAVGSDRCGPPSSMHRAPPRWVIPAGAKPRPGGVGRGFCPGGHRRTLARRLS